MPAKSSRDAFFASPYKTIKHSTYFDSYDYFFADYVGRDIIFVEIGVLGGGSLFMWREFFGPQARIIGVDLNPNAKKWEDHGFEIYIGSQSDPEFWASFVASIGMVDVVLDDGGHTYEQQIVTTECLLPYINDRGILVVEDTHTSYMEGFGPKRWSFMRYAYNRMDAINMRFHKFHDDRQKRIGERRIWSIEVVESMVAFRVRHKASRAISERVENGGVDDQSKDYRHHGDVYLGLFDRLIGRLVPRAFSKYLRKKIVARGVSLKRFF